MAFDPVSIGLGVAGLTSAGLGAYNAYKQNQTAQLPTRNEQIPRYDEKALGLRNNVIGEANNALQQGNYQDIENEILRNYGQKREPLIKERYNSMFGQGSNRSSGYQNTQTQGYNDLQSQLVAAKANFNNNRLSGLLSAGLQPTFDTARVQPNQNTGLGSLFEGASPYLGQLLPLLGNLGGQQNQQQPSYNNDKTDISELFEKYLRNQGQGAGGGAANQFGGIQGPQFGPSPNVQIRQAGF